MPHTPLSANDVRRLAEALDGFRGDPVRVVLRNGALRWLPPGARPLPSDRELFDVQTHDAAPRRPRLGAVRLEPRVVRPNGEAVDDVLDVFDALFWTEPAVSKFVLPYYMRFYSPEDVHALWLAFLGKRPDGTDDAETQVLAFGHLPHSEPEIIEEEDGSRRLATDAADAHDTMALVVAEPAPAAEPEAGAPGLARAAGARERRYRVVTARQFLAARGR